MEKIPLIAVVGPTASGKTGLGIALAKRLNGEIVSTDSMQIYKGISVASAAPTAEERAEVPHHLIEFLDIDEQFTVADYVNLATETIKDIYSRKKQPILVGGTGLYVNSLTEGISFSKENPDLELRNSLTAEYDNLGGEEMLKKLAEFDSVAASRLHPNDKRRIIRAFEIYKSCGTTVTYQNEVSHNTPPLFETVYIGVTFKDREKLYDRINHRVDEMLISGIEAEARKTYNKVTGGALQAIGHKELYPAFSGEITFEQAVENLKRSTRRYAKRQLTWFRKNKNINWIYADEEDVLERAMEILKGVGLVG